MDEKFCIFATNNIKSIQLYTSGVLAMKREEAVFNWFADPPEMTKELRGLISFAGKFIIFAVTIRLGPKWANLLEPGQLVSISISNDPNQPNVLCKALVGRVFKTTIERLDIEDLDSNLGAKTPEGVLEAMRKVYKDKKVNEDSVISVIELWI